MRCRPCAKNPCTFAHGEIELLAWTEERKQDRNRDFQPFSLLTNHPERDDDSDETIASSSFSTNVEEERAEGKGAFITFGIKIITIRNH